MNVSNFVGNRRYKIGDEFYKRRPNMHTHLARNLRNKRDCCVIQ